MATSFPTGTGAQISVQHGHRRAIVLGVIAALACVAAIALVVALSNGGGSTQSSPAATTSGPSITNAGPTDGTPSAVTQALGSTPTRGYSLSTNVYAPPTSGAPISGVTSQISHLPR